jgi:tryptophan synthase beta subunit
MTDISTENANLEQIRLNDASIASVQAGYGTRTRAVGENLRDDSAETIAWLMRCNADLREANAILAAAPM